MGMNSAKGKYHHGNLKSELVSAGVDLVDRSGFDSVSIRELARETSVSPAAALRHFADLSHLKAEISQQARQELARQCLADWRPFEHQPLTAEVAIARFEALSRSYVRFAKEHLNLFNAAFALCDAMPATPDDPSPWSLLDEAVKDLVAAGVIATNMAGKAPLIAWSTVHGIATLESHNLVHVSNYKGDLEELVIEALHRSLFSNNR